MTAAPARRRWAAWGLSLCAAAVLAGCAGGSARPKPLPFIITSRAS